MLLTMKRNFDNIIKLSREGRVENGVENGLKSFQKVLTKLA